MKKVLCFALVLLSACGGIAVDEPSAAGSAPAARSERTVKAPELGEGGAE
jgi:hypothetical protein